MKPISLRRSTMYLVRTRTGQQKLERQHCMTFMEAIPDVREKLVFNARPFAGDQTFYWSDITSVAVVRHGMEGRDSDKHYMNRVVRPSQKASTKSL